MSGCSPANETGPSQLGCRGKDPGNAGFPGCSSAPLCLRGITPLLSTCIGELKHASAHHCPRELQTGESSCQSSFLPPCNPVMCQACSPLTAPCPHRAPTSTHIYLCQLQGPRPRLLNGHGRNEVLFSKSFLFHALILQGPLGPEQWAFHQVLAHRLP